VHAAAGDARARRGNALLVPGSYPACLLVPGAGARARRGYAVAEAAAERLVAEHSVTPSAARFRLLRTVGTENDACACGEQGARTCVQHKVPGTRTCMQQQAARA
jgi:hypothetical protein